MYCILNYYILNNHNFNSIVGKYAQSSKVHEQMLQIDADLSDEAVYFGVIIPNSQPKLLKVCAQGQKSIRSRWNP